MNKKAQELLKQLNIELCTLHSNFEESWWLFKMGDHGQEKIQADAEKARDEFRSNPGSLNRIKDILATEKLSQKERARLETWAHFFELYQTPASLMPLRERIGQLETDVAKKLSTRKEGYINPKSGEFVEASKGKMRMMVMTNPDEAIRKACFDSLEVMALDAVDEYVRLVGMRNEFARALGYEDFYAYRLKMCEDMTKDDVFSIFDEIYEKTKYALEDIRKLEESRPGLRKPWNFGYMMSGSFTLEEDPYFSFDEALIRWGRSFAALGISFKGGQLQLDLLDRKGKYNNGFCHYPALVHFNDGKRNPGAANFTCNVVYGQPGTGYQGAETLFHEAAHAADRLSSEQADVCLNTEWPPASIAWAETHSQFVDTILSSIEWKTRYAKNQFNALYPFELYERKVRQMHIVSPLGIYHIMRVSEFERRVYEENDLTAEKVVSIARYVSQKYSDYSEDSVSVLSVPHIYDWESSAYYHSYGLSELALQQWREYFYDKYGYIVDNPAIGREMNEVWELGSSEMFPEFIVLATGKKLSPEAYLKNATMPIEEKLDRARQRIKRLKKIPEFNRPVKLNAKIRMVHGKEVIADNSISFEDMAEKYKQWLRRQKKYS